MFSAVGMRVLELAHKGYCCSQIMVILGLEQLDRENPDLIRASAALCNGLGTGSGPCGIIFGALLLLGLYTGKGNDFEQEDEQLALLSEEYRKRFTEITAPYGGDNCQQIIAEAGALQSERCGELLVKSYELLRQLLQEYGYELEEGRPE